MSLIVEETNEAYELEKGKVYNLEKLRGKWLHKKNIVTIGRDASNDIILPPSPKTYVPREGCRFFKGGNKWNYISAEGLTQELKTGDLINIGGIVLKFEEKA
jgi:pSer/pThr/pTyr-binding forkhead associated (FHA) protein